MDGDVVDLRDIDQTRVAVVGGKAARLGELARIDGIRVPAGFCVTTEAFGQILAQAPMVEEGLERLALLNEADRDAIVRVSGDIRSALEAVEIPGELAATITAALAQLGERTACAVRSSATAEDSPTASFAGQQDTYLNVVGPAAVLTHIRRCWASLFTERAVTYRLHNGFDHRRARMAVVVQRMVLAQAAGVVFTADPVTSNRKLSSVEATFGLGEALVAGLASPDVYTVRDGAIVAKGIATKQVAIVASPGGGTQEATIATDRQQQPVLTDAQVVELARLGRRIEAHFGQPQDIEWCLDHEGFHIVQSRPITTLFPVPVQHDHGNHVYVSVGHQQMMTDPMRPLGLSFWQLTAARPMSEAGGRLFVDVAPLLASPTSRAHYVQALGRSDPLIGDALETILERGDFVASRTEEDPDFRPVFGEPVPIETDPAIVTGLIERGRAVPRHRAARPADQVRIGAPRRHRLGHRGAQADHVRSRRASGDQGRSRCLVVDQRADGGLAGRKERRRCAHAVRAQQRHVGDGTRTPRRRRCNPSASQRCRLPRADRGRGIHGCTPHRHWRASGARCHCGLPRHVRDALHRRDRHHEDAVERTPLHARAHDPLQRQEFRAG